MVRLRHLSYRPCKAELTGNLHVDGSPEDVARAVGRQVELRYDKPTPTSGIVEGKGLHTLAFAVGHRYDFSCLSAYRASSRCHGVYPYARSAYGVAAPSAHSSPAVRRYTRLPTL